MTDADPSDRSYLGLTAQTQSPSDLLGIRVGLVEKEKKERVAFERVVQALNLRKVWVVMLVGVDSQYFNAGIIFRGNICVDAAPVLKWAIGKSKDELFRYFRKKGWRFEVENAMVGEKPPQKRGSLLSEPH